MSSELVTQHTLIETLSTRLGLAFATNSTVADFPALVPTKTMPSGSGVVSLNTPNSGVTANQIIIYPFGTSENNATYSLRVIGWNSITVAGVTLYVPFTIAELAVILGTTTGVAASPVLNTNFFADTLTLTTGNANIDIVITSPADDTIASALLDIKGCNLVQFTGNLGSAASYNTLWAQL